MAAQPPKRVISPGFSRLYNTQLMDDATGSGTGAANYMYVAVAVKGDYEIINRVDNPASGSITNPTPKYAQYVDLNVDTTVDLGVVNIASGTEASSLTCIIDATKKNVSGGFDLDGNLFTSALGETIQRVDETVTPNIYSVKGSGKLVTLPQHLDTGRQNYHIMADRGPHGTAGTGYANTSATLPGELAGVFSDQAEILGNQADIGMPWSALFSNIFGEG